MSSICGADCSACKMKAECRGCAETCGSPFGGKCIAAEYIRFGGKTAYETFKRGIQTRQIGRRKEKGLRTVELLMAAATLSVVVAELISVALDWNYMPSGARFTGFCLGLCGDVLFLISVLFMKDSWRAGIPEKDKTRLVTNGIYRYSRNPAFCGFDLMYIGVLLLFFNPVSLVFSAFAVVMLHLQILQEEKYMLKTFGDEYAGYKKTVFRYLGRRSKKKQQGE